jgi:hypothetical protein
MLAPHFSRPVLVQNRDRCENNYSVLYDMCLALRLLLCIVDLSTSGTSGPRGLHGSLAGSLGSVRGYVHLTHTRSRRPGRSGSGMYVHSAHSITPNGFDLPNASSNSHVMHSIMPVKGLMAVATQRPRGPSAYQLGSQVVSKQHVETCFCVPS